MAAKVKKNKMFGLKPVKAAKVAKPKKAAKAPAKKPVVKPIKKSQFAEDDSPVPMNTRPEPKNKLKVTTPKL